MQKLLFVYNRHAGRDRHWGPLAEIIATFTTCGYLTTAYPTQCAGDAGAAIAKWGANYDRIVVAGGDGTLNDAAAGLLQLKDPPPFGYIPAGSTNDFSKNLSLPEDIIAQATLAATGEGLPCDLCSFNGTPFVYVAAFGAFADVSFSTPQATKNLFGYGAYLMESLKSLHKIKPLAIKGSFDGVLFEGNYLFGMVSNTRSVGGLQHFPPGNPELDDGLLELTLVSPARDLIELELLGRSMLRGLGDSPLLHSHSARRVTISSVDQPLLWTLDGENGGLHDSVSIEVLPRAFSIVQG